jgi:prepilin-type processing-associated H-X9-DG protein
MASPALDTPGIVSIGSWGSAHLAGVNMAMCDGSVRVMSFSISTEALRRLSDIADGQKIDGKNL